MGEEKKREAGKLNGEGSKSIGKENKKNKETLEFPAAEEKEEIDEERTALPGGNSC